MMVRGCLNSVILAKIASMSLFSKLRAFKVSMIRFSLTGHSVPLRAYSIFLWSVHVSRSVVDSLASKAFRTACTITFCSMSRNLYSPENL